MPIRVLVNDIHHRTLALTNDEYALVFRHTHAAESGLNSSSTSLPLPNANRQSVAPRCMVEFATYASLDFTGYRTFSNAQGTLGLITLNNDVFLCVATGSQQVANPRPGESVQKIHSVEFYCLNRSDYDSNNNGQQANPYPGQEFSSDDVDYGGGFDQGESTAEHPFHALKKLLNGGNFYYSADFDLTSRLQDRAEADTAVDIASLDQGLLWNSYMIGPLLQFRSRLTGKERTALDHSRMLTSVVRGYAATMTIPPSSAPLRRIVSSRPSTLTVISRLSARRAGTRFNSRGVDDDGNVANFVETETIFWSPSGVCFSYIQVRGSIPVFWESSPSLIPGQQKVQITRSREATQPAFDKHFEALEHTYGGVHIVNLLSASKPGEVELTERYRYHIANSSLKRSRGDKDVSEHDLLRQTEFDFHERTKGAGGYEGARGIRPELENSEEAFVYFMSEEITESTSDAEKNTITRPIVVMQQNGVFRVNCLDCLDRTNLVQGLISHMALELFFSHRTELASQDFWMRHSSLWADNGDALSKIYAGTGALKSSFTRHGKMSLAGAFADARKSAARLYVNNFADKGRQNTIDLLLGRLIGQTPVELYDPINDYVTTELTRKASEYTSSRTIHIRVCTFNLNGRTEGAYEDLSPWLCKKADPSTPDPDIVAVAFQEIVELNPSQIMSTDPAHRYLWENAVRRTLNSHDQENPKSGEEKYIILRSGQLVGAALMIFVRASILSSIKNVEGAIKMTGLSGIAGNKGAVAIRMEVASTSLCFVTAHLAAGFANYEERNRDYKTIVDGLRFLKNRSIEDHDSIIWFGDFNYRIGLGHERARQLVATGDLETLYANDQLNLQMVAGVAFPFYSESRIMFPPTYKFDLGSDEYDTSEKNRIPAWTDRVCRKGGNLRQIEYDSAPLKFSDHRPVYATFDCQIKIVEEEKKANLSQRLYDKRKKDVGMRRGAVAGSGDGTESDSDEDIMGYKSIAPGALPPASSDRRKWWLDGDKPARSKVGPPREGMVPNDRRPGNPWRETTEPDWVDVQRPSSTEDIARRLTQGQNSSKNGTNKPNPPPPRRTMIMPSWDGGRVKAGNEIGGDGAVESKARSPIPSLPLRPTDRTASVSSTKTTESTTKRAPPLKPQKPAMLSSSPSQSSTPQMKDGPAGKAALPTGLASNAGGSTPPGVPKPRSDSNLPPLPSRTNTSSSIGSFVSVPSSTSMTAALKKSPPPPVQPRRVSNMQRNDSRDSTRSIRSRDPPGPPLPPRRVDTNEGLMDEDTSKGSMQDWKPLQPKQ